MAPQPSSGGPLKPPHATRVHDTSSADRGWMMAVGRTEIVVDRNLSVRKTLLQNCSSHDLGPGTGHAKSLVEDIYPSADPDDGRPLKVSKRSTQWQSNIADHLGEKAPGHKDVQLKLIGCSIGFMYLY